MKKVAIYARVSTERQEEQKTIESQLSELRKICKKSQIVKEYIDDGWSGEILARPGLDQLRDHASKGLFEAVYIHSVDRLSRNLYHQGIIVEDLKKNGIEIFIGEKPIANTPEGRFMFNVLGAAAEYEKEKILERTRRGKLQKARQGLIVGGIPPYGYAYIKKTPKRNGYYEVNRKEARVADLIIDLYIEFQSERRVIKELTKRKIKPRKGGAWQRSTIHRILINETYIGTTHYNKYYRVETENNNKKYRKVVKTGTKFRNKSEWIGIPVPAIVNKDKFKVVQGLLKRNRRSYPVGRKYRYLLGGLIKCSICGTSFTGEVCHGRLFYRCNNRHKRFPFPRDCNAKMISVNKLDVSVWNALSKAVMHPRILISHISHLAKKINEGKDILKKEEKELLEEKDRLEYKKDKLLEIYTEGGIEKEQFFKKMETFNKEEEELSEEIKGKEIKLTQVIDRPILIEDIKYFCKLAEERLKNFSFEQKQQFLGYLIDKIEFNSIRREAKVIGYIPLVKEEEGLDLKEILTSQSGIMHTLPL